MHPQLDQRESQKSGFLPVLLALPPPLSQQVCGRCSREGTDQSTEPETSCQQRRSLGSTLALLLLDYRDGPYSMYEQPGDHH